MSPRRTESRGRAHRRAAPLFAALGDETRLLLLDRLSSDASLSISSLARGTAITRQAVTKHLRVLSEAGLVRCRRNGRETRYELEPEAVLAARRRLDEVSLRWDRALGRLKALVEDASNS